MVEIKLELPDGYLDEEERDGFLVSREQKQIWAVELDLLYELMRVCQKYDIKYFADAGTMLGMIRHGGFIPWDDDIDLIMTRGEYRKLDEIAPKEFRHPYFWQTERTDLGSMRGHAQLRNSGTTGILQSELEKKFQFNQGIFIDIFPLDYVPENTEERETFFAEIAETRAAAVHNAYYTSRFQEKGTGVKKVARNLYHNYMVKIKKKNQAYEKFEKVLAKYDSNPTEKIGRLFFKSIPDRFVWKSEWLKESVPMPFEMFELPVPTAYDAILSYFYGDWRTPVKGSTYHGGIFYDVNKPYTEYIKQNAETGEVNKA